MGLAGPHPADEDDVGGLGDEAAAEDLQDRVAAEARHRLPAPQRLGPARRLPAPGRRHACRQPRRRRRRRGVAERQRQAPLADPLGLVHQQRPHPQVDGQPGRGVRQHQPAADVQAGAGLGVPAVVPQPNLEARPERHPAGERVGARTD